MTAAARTRLVIAALALLTAALFAGSLLVGPAGFGMGESLRALLSGQGDAIALVMREIRLPRALLALLIGAGLGASGATLQGYLRNPLAEPGLLGISGAAALGAVLALYTGLSAAFPLALPLSALTGAIAATVLLQGLAGSAPGSISLILAGVAVSSLAGALTSLVLNLSPNPFAASEIVYWLLGSLADRSMAHVWLAGPFIVAGIALLALTGRALDALTLGEDAAASMGVDIRRTRTLAVLGTALAVGAGVAVAGSIGFIGLVVPHLLRPITGGLPSRLLPASALGGAALLLAADLAVRLIAPDRDLKLGVLTALVGAPFFFWLVQDHVRAARKVKGADSSSYSLDASRSALERNGLIRTLAEPNLTAISGETAKFLAGGEYPIPMVDSTGSLSVTYKEFGVGVAFTPTVMSEGRISLKIETEVSELTNNGAVTLAAIAIPALKKRSAKSTVELPSGGSLAMAGLLSNDTRQNIDGFPGLKDLPVLGTLFRSRDYIKQESELVVIVTPYLVRPTARKNLAKPIDGLADATDRKANLLGHLNAIYGHGSAPPTGDLKGDYGFIVD